MRSLDNIEAFLIDWPEIVADRERWEAEREPLANKTVNKKKYLHFFSDIIVVRDCTKHVSLVSNKSGTVLRETLINILLLAV